MEALLAQLELMPQLLRGARITLQLTLMTAVVGFFLSFAVALARGAPWRWLRWATAAYVEVFRGTSAMVQLFFLFFILPAYGLTLPPMLTAVVTLGLNMSAYGSEIVRGGIATVGQGQRDAARALGLSAVQTWRTVILPQAMVVALPSFGNLLIELLKATSLVSLITITELTFAGRQMVVTTGLDFEVWTLVLLLYFAMAWPLSLLVQRAETRATRFRG